MIIIKRLYVENYKLFSRKEIDFSNALLSVFDGPNGYGKTSIFDAVELLVTGKISRVKDCESIDGKLAYQTIFFAQNSEKDVIIKAEFEDDEVDRYFVLGARVRPANISGKFANPKNIFECIEFGYLPSYDIPFEAWDEYIQSNDAIATIRNREFGKHNIEQFTLFHYIRQEDRLAYFKQSETSRSTTIEDLLGVAAEREKQKNIKEKRRAVEKLFKQLDEEIQRKRKRLIKADTPNEQTVEYESLIDGKQMWDREVIYFGDYNQDKVLSQYLFELEKLESYVKHNDYHENYFSYEKFMSISEKMRSNALLALLLLQKDSLSIDDIDIYYQNLIFLKQQQEKIDLQEYSSVNFSKVCNIIGVSEDENLLSAIDVLSNISRNQSELQKAVNNVLQIRENLHNNHSQILENGVCPYCGHDWNTSKELETQFVSTKNILYNLLAQDGELYAKQLEIVKSQIDEKIIDVLKCKITELSNNDILMVYSEFDSKAKFANALESARPLYNICFNSMVDSGFSAEDVNEYWVQLLEMCLNIGNSIPAEYLAANMKYSFAEIRKKYALDLLDASKLSKEKFALKRQYLQEQFYRSFDKLKEEIHNLETKKDTIEVIKSQLKEYENALGNSIEAYKKQIIDEIEIPFFVYSSRLLQSYQGGQGVLLKNDGESIRFTSPGNEHDVLYTMSSGQLSAVLLSFSLALNKIYSGRGIKTILIDDPIQCMDDINMISFVELLRREFSECQIILSTHEESFSNFVRYKFKKYGLNTQVITLKDA